MNSFNAFLPAISWPLPRLTGSGTDSSFDNDLMPASTTARPTTGSLDVKLHVATRVLSRMGGSIRRSVAYVDVSAPARPAIGYKK